MDHLVIRTDAYGKHFITKDGSAARCTVKEPLDRAILLGHFSKADPIIGIFTTSVENKCKFLVIDIDCHAADETLASQNQEFAESIASDLEQLGMACLLLDSNGKGGYHVFVIFDEPIPANVARSFGRWLVRDHQDFRLFEPEVFPKQDSIKGKFGNFVRLFGKHHKRSFYTKVWNGQEFIGGQEAIDLILNHRGVRPESIPSEASNFQPPKTQRSHKQNPGDQEANWWLKYGGDLRTLDLVGLLESNGCDVTPKKKGEFLIECPWAEEHTTGDNTALIREAR